jgi:putative DNA methylase
MTKLIERWFPCQEVSDNSDSGWGSGNAEKAMFTWFAARPLAQAKAAVICSLFPWPDEPAEQLRLQTLVRESMTGRDAKHDALVSELAKYYPDGVSMLDPFSGRALIPLEAARVGVKTWGIDYSPVATLAGTLLADYPLRNWDDELPLPLKGYRAGGPEDWGKPRLLKDVEFVLDWVGQQFEQQMDAYYPRVNGKRPWGYLWSVTLPCQNCGNRFPLVGSLVLRYPNPKNHDPGQSFAIRPDDDRTGFVVEVHDGPPVMQPTRTLPQGQSRHSSKGKVGVCVICEHTHTRDVLERVAGQGGGRDALLLVGDLDPSFNKQFRLPTSHELSAVEAAEAQLPCETPFAPGVPATPNERIPPGNTWTIQPSLFGAHTYGDMCNARQTLGFIRLARVVDGLGRQLLDAGMSPDYAAALTGYAASVLVRKMMRSTRGATLLTYKDGRSTGVQNIFAMSESSIAFSYDYLEAGLTNAVGGWSSIAERTLSTLKDQLARPQGLPALIQQGSATALPLRPNFLDAVVTDPPYEEMIDYTDASDLFYVWLKRALGTTHPFMAVTADQHGLQEKDLEIIVKKGGGGVGDHRTKEWYDDMLGKAFAQARQVVKDDGVVTIVFGHGDPEVWHRLLNAVDTAGLVLTGSWPARTEKGGRVGSANIQTTLTLACRPAPPARQPGRVAEVDAEVRREIKERLPLWEAAGLALTDQLMASAGPAMEVVGRYSEVRDKTGKPVALDRYLPFARQMVQEAADIRIDDLPLGAFDERTRFALFWAKVFKRSVTAASEARWQRLAADLAESATAGVLAKVAKGARLAFASESATPVDDIDPMTPVFDIALSMAADGASLAHAAEVLIAADKVEDPYVWAAVRALSDWVPDADPDGEVWTWLTRNKGAVQSATRNLAAVRQREIDAATATTAQGSLDLGDGR